jgi:lon-related putative ATP-dependent protease
MTQLCVAHEPKQPNSALIDLASGSHPRLPMRQLKPDELRAVCDPASLPFRSTEELSSLDVMIGQERALSATAFGIGVRHHGYNLFALGPAATGKTTTMQRLLGKTAQDQPVSSDYCYVHNFTDPYRPSAIEVPAGRGRELRDEMARLVEECKTRLPRAFEGEEFERQKSKILEDLARRQEKEMAHLEETAKAAGFALVRTPTGLAVAPAPEGKPLSHEEFGALSDAEKSRLAGAASEIEASLEATLRQVRQHEREARQAQEKLVSEVAAAATRQLIRELRERFGGIDGVQRYLDEVEKDLVAHAEDFSTAGEGKPALPFLPAPGAFLDRYRVNVLVDRSGAQGAPVVFEQNPTYANLVGRIEHRAQFGTLVTDFTLIRAGALHRANGGYLILEAKDVLRNFQAWESLKKSLKSRSIRIEEPLEEFRMVTAAGLAPEPIVLSVKVVLIGNPFYYYLLHRLDEDFRELFKVKVDFDDSFGRTPETELLYARFISGSCRDSGLRHFGADAVAKLVEHGSRLVAHQGRLSSRLGALLDFIRDAAFYAERHLHACVTAEDVSHAIEQKVYRSNLIEERLGRMIAEGTLLITTDGEAIGQVNGISVLSTGDHAFGRPSRITVRTYSGEPGVVDIEREAKLGGPIHSKGVMILTGFLAGRYARERPLALSASVTFEQLYEEVEGDSASSAELYALLSSLSGIPLSQSIAVTGSVNQRGEIQPVGGINEKIEGFFDVCRARGLTGRHGVMIPEANARHLMLREDVVQAVREGQFHVHAVSTVDEGLEILSGRPAGERSGPRGAFPEGSFNAAVERALAENVERLKALRANSHGAAAQSSAG